MRIGTTAGFLFAALVLAAGCETRDISTASPGLRNESGGRHETRRHQVDPMRERAWRLTADGVVVSNVWAPGNTVVPLPGWTWADAPWSCMPDMALGPRGEAVVTSNVVAVVWRIDPDTLAVSEHPLTLDVDGDKDLGFTGLVYSREHDAYFAVSGPHGTLWKINSELTHGTKVVLPMAMYGACQLAIDPRIDSQASSRTRVRLCASGEERNWTVDVVIALPGQLRAEDAKRRPVAVPQLNMSCGD